MRKILSLMVILCLFLTFGQGFAKAETDVVTIFHTNDMHAYIESGTDDEGNLNKMGLEHVAAIHAAYPDSLLVDAGDYCQGSIFGNMTHGLSVYEAMEAAGYDVVALGNHEFDWGVDEFEENVKTVSFPVISANVTVDEAHKDKSPYLYNKPDYVVKEAKGHKIAFIGLDTSQLNGMVNPATLREAGIQVRTDLTQLTKELVEKIRTEEPDVQAIVAITHCGYSEDPATEGSYNVAGVEGISVVIDGHDHENLLGDNAKNVNGTLVVSTGTQLAHLGKLEFTFDGDKLMDVRSSDALEEALALEGDPTTLGIIESWKAQIDAIRNQVTFTSDVNFWGGNLNGYNAAGEEVTASVARRGYTNAGQLISDARLWKAKNWLAANHADYDLDPNIPIVSLFGGGSVRGSFRAGDITLGGLMSCYSFSFEGAEDTYVLITPKVLYDTIEHGVNIFQSQDPVTGQLTADGSIHGRFPHVAGCSYVYDITQPASAEYDKENNRMPDFIGSRVQSITLDDGTVLDKEDNETPILLITSSYEIGGGDSYWMLGVLNDAPEYGGYQFIPEVATPEGNCGDAVVDYVKEVYGGHVTAADYPLSSNRIVRVNDVYTGEHFDAVVTVTTDGTALRKNEDFTVYVNGQPEELSTDANGVLTVSMLRNGPNEIRILGNGYDSGSIYLDNFCGLTNPVATHTPGEIPLENPHEVQPEPEPELAPEPTPEPAPRTIGNLVPAAILMLCVCAAIAFMAIRNKKK